jgi:hypothetical protein
LSFFPEAQHARRENRCQLFVFTGVRGSGVLGSS